MYGNEIMKHFPFINNLYFYQVFKSDQYLKDRNDSTKLGTLF